MNLKEHAEVFRPNVSDAILRDIQCLTTVHVENLRKLIEVLKGVNPEKFNMCDYDSGCGTIHCAAGWAKHFGIGDVESYRGVRGHFSFNSYTIFELCGSHELLLYMFGGVWALDEPTIEQAIQRIERVIHEFERTRC